MKCLFCNKDIPLTRRHNGWLKYCSIKCNKNAWYLRKYPTSKSHINNNPLFWETETGKGFYWEKWSAKLLGAKHLEFNNSGADLDWNGKLIDVKSCELYKRKYAHGKLAYERFGYWIFNRNNNKPIDYFLCICLKSNKLVKKYLIPNNLFPKKGMSIGKLSPKYDKFIF
jgi:hypothetical protein